MNWDEYSAILFEQCKQRGIPFSACFELTPLCNFSCNMCYIRLTPQQAASQGKMLTTNQWIQLAQEAKQMGVVNLEVTGGEAITRSDFSVLYEQFATMGFLINLRSNGYLISDTIVDLLKAYQPQRIGITLYGASDETYQRVCSIHDGFSVVSRNILALRDAGFKLSLSMTVTKDNEQDRDQLKTWAKANDLDIRMFGGLLTPIRGAKRSIEHLRFQSSSDVFTQSDNREILDSHTVANRERYESPFWMCRGFGAMFCITWDGHLTLCNSLPAIWKNPFKKGLDAAYRSLYTDLRKLHRPDKCNSCQLIDYCTSCPSRLYSETGSTQMTNDRICERAMRAYSLHRHLANAQ